MDAFSRFVQNKPGDCPVLTMTGRGRVALVAFLFGSWQWTLFDDAGRVVAGSRSWGMGATDACEQALAAFESHPAADVTAAPEPPPVDPADWTPDPDRATEDDTP